MVQVQSMILEKPDGSLMTIALHSFVVIAMLGISVRGTRVARVESFPSTGGIMVREWSSSDRVWAGTRTISIAAVISVADPKDPRVVAAMGGPAKASARAWGFVR